MGFKETDECLKQVAPDEPIFILRAQDLLAPDIVRRWANKAAIRLGDDHPKVAEARAMAIPMEAWPARKYPD